MKDQADFTHSEGLDKPAPKPAPKRKVVKKKAPPMKADTHYDDAGYVDPNDEDGQVGENGAVASAKAPAKTQAVPKAKAGAKAKVKKKAPAKHAAATGDNSQAQLARFIERVENLEEEKAEIAADIKEVYAEAKSFGFDTKIMRKAVAQRKRNPKDIEEERALLDLYVDTVAKYAAHAKA